MSTSTLPADLVLRSTASLESSLRSAGDSERLIFCNAAICSAGSAARAPAAQLPNAAIDSAIAPAHRTRIAHPLSSRGTLPRPSTRRKLLPGSTRLSAKWSAREPRRVRSGGECGQVALEARIGHGGGVHPDDLDPLAAGQAGDRPQHRQAVVAVGLDRAAAQA